MRYDRALRLADHAMLYGGLGLFIAAVGFSEEGLAIAVLGGWLAYLAASFVAGQRLAQRDRLWADDLEAARVAGRAEGRRDLIEWDWPDRDRPDERRDEPVAPHERADDEPGLELARAPLYALPRGRVFG